MPRSDATSTHPACEVTLIYPDDRRVVVTVVGVQASMSGSTMAERSSIVVQRRLGPGRRETLCIVHFDDLDEFAGAHEALAALRAWGRGDGQEAADLAGQAAVMHDGWSPLRSLLREGSWVCATLQLADGSTVELYLEGVVAVVLAGYEADPGEAPVIAHTDHEGVRRQKRLAQLFAG